MYKEFAPIALFTYNRLWHTQQTIEALRKNEFANESKLFIFSDGGKDDESWEKVNKVRRYLEAIDGFKEITLVFQENNIGLADSIIHGVTKIINEHGKIIVLEDDIVTSSYFLKFMNDALNYYENEEKVWHINGWNYPININGLGSTFFYREMKCWGWGTWKSKWQYFEKDPEKIMSLFSDHEIKRFNLDGVTDFFIQIQCNLEKKLNTWAIFWYAAIFKNNGLCLSPSRSFVNNIGFDGSGIHSGFRDNYHNDISRDHYDISFETNLVENSIAVEKIKLFYLQTSNPNILFSKNLNKIIEFLKRMPDTESYIIYGSGTGFDLISNYICKIDFILDKDPSKHNTSKNGYQIISPKNLSQKDNGLSKIIISTLGRAREVTHDLNTKYNIPKERIVSLDILNN